MCEDGGFCATLMPTHLIYSKWNQFFSFLLYFLIKGLQAFEADELAAQRQIASHQFAPGELFQKSHQDSPITNVFEQVTHGSWRIALGATKCEINSLASAKE